MNQLRTGFFKRSVQMISYAPYFHLDSGHGRPHLCNSLTLRRGPVNIFLQALGLERGSLHGHHRPLFLDLCLVRRLAEHRI